MANPSATMRHATEDSNGRALRVKAHETATAFRELGTEAKRYASGRMRALGRRAGDIAGVAKGKADDINDLLAGYIHRHPYRSLAMAAGAGFMAGFIIKRLRRVTTG